MKKRSLLPLSLILLFQLIAAVHCSDKFPIPEQFINGDFTARPWIFSDSLGQQILIDTLLPCQKKTILQFDVTSHVYQTLPPDSTCPLIPPFYVSGTWKILQAKHNFSLDDRLFDVENVVGKQFDLILPGAYRGRSGKFRATLTKQ